MALKQIVLFAVILTINLDGIQGHGRVTDPVHRGYAWMMGFDTPVNFNDNGNFCGGFGVSTLPKFAVEYILKWGTF